MQETYQGKSTQSGVSRTGKGKRGNKSMVSFKSQGGALQPDSAVGMLGCLLCSGQGWAEDCWGWEIYAQESLVLLLSQGQPTSYPYTHIPREGWLPFVKIPS